MDFKKINQTLEQAMGIQEAKLDDRFQNVVDFENVGCGIGVEVHSNDKVFGIELTGFSNNTSKSLTFLTNIPNDYKLSDEEQDTNHAQAKLLAAEITQELKQVADEFDNRVLEILQKHGLERKMGA